MNDLLWGLFLGAWLIFFVRHIVKWRRGETQFWDQRDYNNDREIPAISGLSGLADRIQLAEKETKLPFDGHYDRDM